MGQESPKKDGRSGYRGKETRRLSQGHKAGQVLGNSSGTQCWRAVHDATKIWQSVFGRADEKEAG